MWILPGDVNPLSPAIVAVVSPMPHMTKSQSGFETREREEEVKETSPGTRSGGEDPLRGELIEMLPHRIIVLQ